MSVPFISFEEGEQHLDWLRLTDAFIAGHKLPKAEISDTFLYRDPDTMLSRAAWIDGLGLAVKTATIFPGNQTAGRPMVNGTVCLFSNSDGTLDGMVDFHLVTKWKTAADSLLGARLLADPAARNILIVGAGTVGASLCEAFHAGFPEAGVSIWNRTLSKAEELAARYPFATAVPDLEPAVTAADIVITATMTTDPIIQGDWLRPGQHLSLIGAYRPDMREVDDRALQRSRLFVDSFDTTLDHIGELKLPLASGAIRRADVLADYYTLDDFQTAPTDISIFKNGGGAHLDLITSRHIFDLWTAAR